MLVPGSSSLYGLYSNTNKKSDGIRDCSSDINTKKGLTVHEMLEYMRNANDHLFAALNIFVRGRTIDHHNIIYTIFNLTFELKNTNDALCSIWRKYLSRIIVFYNNPLHIYDRNKESNIIIFCAIFKKLAKNENIVELIEPRLEKEWGPKGRYFDPNPNEIINTFNRLFSSGERPDGQTYLSDYPSNLSRY